MVEDIATLLIAGKKNDMDPVVFEAARLAFPSAGIKSLRHVKEVLRERPPPDGELLVLLNPSSAEAAKALEAKDDSNLPRWPVVGLGSSGDAKGMEMIPPEEWQAPLLARVFRAAVTQFSLRRENRRMQGDLRTSAYRVSHDLRTPLSAILFTSHALKKTSTEDAPLVECLLRSSEEIDELIERVNFVLKASTDSVSKTPVEIEPIVSKVVASLKERITAKQAELTQPASWPETRGVDAWIEVIWGNLLANALEHGGQPPRIELGWDEDAEYLRFWVRDHGGGVEPARRGDLFRPFHTLHEGTGQRGLGLSIVERLVDLQGGYCGYESLSEGGSRFFFALPKLELGKHLKKIPNK